MRFYPRNRQSRHDALVGPEHVAQHPVADDLTERDRLARYSRGYGATVTGTVTANESNVVSGDVKATGILTLTPGAIVDDKVEIDGIYYQFAAAITDGAAAGSLTHPWQVLDGVDDAHSLTNLAAAINASGTAGTDYSTALTAHPTVESTAHDATSVTVTALADGGNAITTSVVVVTTDDGLAWGDTTLSGEVDGITLNLVVGGDDLFAADVISAQSAALIGAFPATDGLQAALAAENFSLSADHKTLTLVLPAIGAYSISADASYDVTLPKELFLHANDTIVVASAINIVNGA